VTGSLVFLTVWGTLFVLQTALILYGRVYLSAAAAILATTAQLVDAIILRTWLGIALGIFSLAWWIILFYWRGPRNPKRAKKLIGDETRQIRDGLVRRAREARSPRSLSPSPRVLP
jgi:hypothetical protein